MGYPWLNKVPVRKIKDEAFRALPNRTTTASRPRSTCYYFEFPGDLAGQLIGPSGRCINKIKKVTNTNVIVKPHPHRCEYKIISIEGTPLNVGRALELIRRKFPLEIYPHVTLDSVPYVEPPIEVKFIWMRLSKELDNEVIVTSVYSASHLFLLQPNHPKYEMLVKLTHKMREHYNSTESPPPIADVTLNSVCVAPGPDGWYRALIVYITEEPNFCLVSYLDFGGRKYFHPRDLRKIHKDFLDLQFQAVECYLANVAPVNGEWTEDALEFVKELIHRKILRANIYGYSENGVPLICLYTRYNEEVLPINKLLVDHGYARFVDN